MKSLALTAAALLVGTGSALADPMTSGRPTAVLDNAQCQKVWGLAVEESEYLPADQARPWIVNFKLADGDRNGKLSHDEFTFACGKGLVEYGPGDVTEAQ